MDGESISTSEFDDVDDISGIFGKSHGYRFNAENTGVGGMHMVKETIRVKIAGDGLFKSFKSIRQMLQCSAPLRQAYGFNKLSRMLNRF
jgi:hypothetical protein